MRLQARPSGLPAASSDSRQAIRAVDHTRPVPFHLYVRTLPPRHRLHTPAVRPSIHGGRGATDCTCPPAARRFRTGGGDCQSRMPRSSTSTRASG